MGAYEKRKTIQEEIRKILDASGLTFGEVEAILEKLYTDYRRFAYRMNIGEVAICRERFNNQKSDPESAGHIPYEDPQ